MSKWDNRLDKAEKFLEKAHNHGRKVYRRYKDDRSDDNMFHFKRVNLFYSNVNTLKESLFNSMPKPEVSRVQRGDFEDEPSRVAALIMQRGLTYEINASETFDEAISSAIIDRLVPGIGQVWITFDESEQIKVESVYWEDFLYEPCRKWSKCGWVGRRVHMSKKDFVEAYGEETLKRVIEKEANDGNLTPKEINKDKICVYEIWDKRTRKVYHISKGLEEPIKEIDDPYQLRGFFPCPRPLIANVDTTSFLPVTDYHLAQDQYQQLDILYGRIDLIIKAMKVAGLYDGANTEIARMLEGAENILIPVDNWAMHAERGGAKGQIDWFPVEQVATVLQQLHSSFEAIKAMLYEVTGMSDIIRGASSEYETAAAQQIKAQFASVRMNGYQRDVARFVRDVMRIMGEMFTQLYSDEKILQIIGNLAPDDVQYLPQAAQILRNDILTKYKVDIQSNSLTQADWALEKEQRMEVVQTLGQMIGQIQQLVMQSPEMSMLGVQLVKFAIAGYKAGTELEGWIDKQLDAMAQTAKNPQPKEPSAEEKKAQADMQKSQMEAQLDQQRAQMELQIKQAEAQMKQQMMQMELQYKQQLASLDVQIKQVELMMKQRSAGLELAESIAEQTLEESNRAV